MKRLYYISFLSLYTFAIHAQDHVFVLVDVSLSIKQTELTYARQAVYEVLTGTQLSRAFISQGVLQDLDIFKIKQGDKLSVSKFGSEPTTSAISPNPITIQNIPADIIQALNSIEWIPTDRQTYLTLAKAKIAEYAKNQNINKYKLYIVSDNINDDYGRNGRPNYPDDYTRNLVEGYNASTNPVLEGAWTKLKFSQTSDFSLSFSQSVDVSRYTVPSSPGATASTPSAAISISTPKGKKENEYVLKTETLNLNWTCMNCPQDIRYTVNIIQYDGGKYKDIKKDLSANVFLTKLPDGKFRITVSSSNYSASSDTTYVTVSTGGYGWLLFLFILLAGTGVGYYFWNKRRQQKIEDATNVPINDIFGQNVGTTHNTSNSDYF